MVVTWWIVAFLRSVSSYDLDVHGVDLELDLMLPSCLHPSEMTADG